MLIFFVVLLKTILAECLAKVLHSSANAMATPVAHCTPTCVPASSL